MNLTPVTYRAGTRDRTEHIFPAGGAGEAGTRLRQATPGADEVCTPSPPGHLPGGATSATPQPENCYGARSPGVSTCSCDEGVT